MKIANNLLMNTNAVFRNYFLRKIPHVHFYFLQQSSAIALDEKCAAFQQARFPDFVFVNETTEISMRLVGFVYGGKTFLIFLYLLLLDFVSSYPRISCSS